MIEKRDYLDDWSNYISTKYSYDDNVTARNGQFNGAYLTKKEVLEVKDADGNLVEDKNGSKTGTVYEDYKYNYYGQMTDYIDGNGKTTEYTYDLLGRVLTTTLPDNGGKSKVLAYDDTLNTVTSTDENGNNIRYDYDGLGNLSYEQVYDTTTSTYKNVHQYSYDSQCKLDWEKDLAGSAYTDYTYYTDGRLNTKVVTDYSNSNALVYQETYTYNDATSDNYSVVTKVVKGDTNSPDITTKSYINKHGRLEKVERLHTENGVSKTYTDAFKYDYIGNKTEELAARASDEAWAETYTAKYDYDYAGKVVKQYNVSGDYITTAYDALGRVKSVTDIKGSKASPTYSTTYEYDNLGRVIKEKIPFSKSGTTTYYTVKKHYYDRNGNVICEAISNNKPGSTDNFSKTEYKYNSRNLLETVITYDAGVAENYTQYYYDSVGNKKRMYTGLWSPLVITGLDAVTVGKDESYSITKYDYNSLNLMSKMTDPLTKSESYTYDLAGRLKTKTDRNGNTTTFNYDALDNIKSKTVTNSASTVLGSYTYKYCITGNMSQMAGGGTTVTYVYDDLGRLTSETDTLSGTVKTYNYDASNNRKSLTLKKGTTSHIITTYTYDKLDRLDLVKENGTTVADYGYDANGNRLTLAYSTNGNSTSYIYNLANKLETLTNKVGTTTLSQYTYTYYLDGNQASKTDSVSGKATSYVYDDLGRLKTETEAASGITSATRVYTYDDYNNRKTLSVDGVSTTNYEYDKNNRLTSEYKSETRFLSDMDWVSATNGYSPVERDMSNGEGAAGDGKVITLNGVTYEKGLGVHANSEIVYNLGGKYSRFISDIGIDDEVNNGGVKFKVYLDDVLAFDSGYMDWTSTTQSLNISVEGKNQMKLVVDSWGGNSYDHADWAGARLRYPSSTTVEATTYTYDNNGNQTIKSVATQGRAYLSDMVPVSSTNGNGPLEKDMSSGEGLLGDGRAIKLNGVVYEKGLGAHANSELVYNLNGQYSNFISDIGIDDEVTIDGCVKFLVYGDGKLLYDSGEVKYDAATKNVNVSVTGVQQLKLVVDCLGCLYSDHADWAGARVVTTGGTSSTTYAYGDGFNQLTKVTEGTNVYSYTYGGDGLRLTKTVNSVKTIHVWDGQQMVAELNSSGTVTNKYIRGINQIYVQDSAGTKKFYLFNGHADVVHLTNTSGTVIKNYDYDAFGVEKSPDSSDVNPFRYCGEYYDKETGTIYLRARYYNPGTGRFITEDSYSGKANDPLSLNLYIYCDNSPIIRVDPSGFDSYIFYDPSDDKLVDVSEAQERSLNLKYDTPVHRIAVNGAEQLKENWDNMGIGKDGKNFSIDEVVLIFHANPNSIRISGNGRLITDAESKDIPSDGVRRRFPETSGDVYIRELKQKNIRKLYLFGCNSGHLDVKDNCARTFLRYQSGIWQVDAWDGTISTLKGFSAILPWEQEGFYEYVPENKVNIFGQKRSPRGRISYTRLGIL